MGLIGGTIGYRLLKFISPAGVGKRTDGSVYKGRSKMEVLFGVEIWDDIVGKKVIDFGCGDGHETVEMAKRGAKVVIGVDKLEHCLELGREAASNAGVSECCTFSLETSELADTIVSIDAFEHFSDPAEILDSMSRIIRPNGVLWIVFGPPWYHPYGAHGLSVFPWAHLIMSESSLMRWRSDFKEDGAKRFEEIDIGLNKMTTHHFEKLVEKSKFRFDELELVPIRSMRYLSNVLTKEFVTSIVRCRLVLKDN